MVELAGVTLIETRIAFVTVRRVVPETDPEVAVMIVEPAVAPTAKPSPSIVAIAVLDELQVTVADRSCMVPSVKTPVAANCREKPTGMDGTTGVSPMETTVAAVTVRVTVPVTVPDVAVIVDDPGISEVVRPLAPNELLMTAIEVSDELQVTLIERSFVEPSP
jgi:hypothetical protein